jgi:adenosine deaminase
VDEPNPSLLDVFRPLFEVTQDPQSHPELHVFLQRVVGFDTVDDESKVERRIHKKFPYPQFWDLRQSPPYSYWFVFVRPFGKAAAHRYPGCTTCMPTQQALITGDVFVVSVSSLAID